MRPSTCGTALAGIALFAACAHRPSNQAEVDQLNRSIETLRAQNTAYAKQVEELENRLFIVSDQLESRKVNDEKVATPTLPTPALPTVTLHPESDASAASFASAPAGTETASEPEIEYAGEAAQSSGQRPILRLHGDSAEVQLPRESATPAPGIRISRESAPKSARSENAEAVALYRRAFNALRASKTDEAAQGFRDFLRAHPNHDLADNSQYWLGECFYDRKDYASAVREFRRVIERYPSGNKVPDALLKVGYSYLSLGSVEAGRQTLVQLVRSYPRHEAASLAGARLTELNRSIPNGEDSGRSATTAVKAIPNSKEAP